MSIAPAPSYEDNARALLDARMDTIRALAATRQKCADKRAELAVADREDAAAFAAAVRAGWSAEELKKVGFDDPGRRLPGRPPRARPSSTRPASAPTAEAEPAEPGERERAGGPDT